MSKCACISCHDCCGSGVVWYSFSGEYLGNHRCDDLDNMERCEECGGSGITETCEYCRFMMENEEHEKYENTRKEADHE